MSELNKLLLGEFYNPVKIARGESSVLAQKFSSVIDVMEQHHVRLQEFQEQGGMLLISCIAPTMEARNRVWNQIGEVSPGYNDVIAVISMNPGFGEGMRHRFSLSDEPFAVVKGMRTTTSVEPQLEAALELLTNGRLLDTPRLSSVLHNFVDDTSAIPYTTTMVRMSSYADMSGNLVGMGVGYKDENDREGGELSLKFYVKEKRPRSGVTGEFIPPWLELPGIGRVLTDVEEVGPFELETLKSRLRPVPGGYSVGHSKVKGGSIGCLVRKRSEPRNVFVLSASHVIAESGFGKKGDDVLQPSLNDGGTLADSVAKLADWVPFNLSLGYTNRADAAIAGPITKAECRPDIAVLGFIPRGVQQNLSRGMEVQKVGRGSGYTVGTVRDTKLRLPVTYKKPGGGFVTVRFLDQVFCTPYTSSGDSGALVLDREGFAVGLHLGRYLTGSVFSPIQPVLDSLDIDLVTNSL